MSQTLTISDTLYRRLESAARQHGLTSIEQLLELWQTREMDLNQRRHIVQQIDSVRAKLLATYGELLDSSVVIKWLVPEPHSADAHRLLNDYQAGTLTFLAPDLLHSEIGNIIWK